MWLDRNASQRGSGARFTMSASRFASSGIVGVPSPILPARWGVVTRLVSLATGPASAGRPKLSGPVAPGHAGYLNVDAPLSLRYSPFPVPARTLDARLSVRTSEPPMGRGEAVV